MSAAIAFLVLGAIIGAGACAVELALWWDQ